MFSMKPYIAESILVHVYSLNTVRWASKRAVGARSLRSKPFVFVEQADIVKPLMGSSFWLHHIA